VADACLLAGFLLIVIGVGLWSIAAACLTAGVILFLAGGAMRRGGDA
jgi:hypothetical protein